MTTSTYRVSGMKCDHCAQAVTGEMNKIAGVTDVQVALDSGEVTVQSEQPLDDTAVRAAVTEAGYKLAD